MAGEALNQVNEIRPPSSASVEIKREYKDIERLFVAMAKNKASDLHLKGNMKPVFRIATGLHEVGSKLLISEEVQRLIYDILTEDQKKHYEENGDLDFAHSIEGIGRFRINVFRDRGMVAVAVRRVNNFIPNIEDLNLPDTIKKIAGCRQGLVLVVGPTGQGKSTTLAAILQYVNRTRREHVITLEDPIEYLFDDDKSFFNQREIGVDVPSFHDALKYILRQNPDIILLGELRDTVSVEAGLMAAETGHLVFATLHASSAAQTLGRMLDLFSPEKQEQIRQLLMFNLKAVVCQRLVPGCKEGVRMVPVVEIMITNPIIQKLIQEKQDKKIQDAIRAGEEEGMQDFNQSLVKLVKTGLVAEAVAMKHSPNPEQLKMALKGITLSDDKKIIT